MGFAFSVTLLIDLVIRLSSICFCVTDLTYLSLIFKEMALLRNNITPSLLEQNGLEVLKNLGLNTKDVLLSEIKEVKYTLKEK